MSLPFTISSFGVSKTDAVAIAAMVAMIATVAYQSPKIVTPWISTDFILTSLENKYFTMYKNDSNNRHAHDNNPTDSTSSATVSNTEAVNENLQEDSQQDHNTIQGTSSILSETAVSHSALASNHKANTSFPSSATTEAPVSTAEIVDLLKSLKNNTSNPILTNEITGNLVALFQKNLVAVNLLCQDLIASPSTDNKKTVNCSHNNDIDECTCDTAGVTLDFRARNAKALDTFEAVCLYYVEMLQFPPLEHKQANFARMLQRFEHIVRPALRVMLDNFIRDGRVVLFDNLDVPSVSSNSTETAVIRIDTAELSENQKQDYLLYQKANMLYNNTKWS